MICARFNDLGIELRERDAPTVEWIDVEAESGAHINEKGFSKLSRGGSIQFTDEDQSFPQLAALLES